MHLLFERKPVHLQLKKELTRAIKRGHAWLYSDAIELIRGESGVPAVVHDRKGQAIACGIYDPQHPLPLRICRTQAPWLLDDAWLSTQLARAAALRGSLFDQHTTGFRLVAGEGDGIPGLIIDIYADVAVIKLDGGGPQAFYRPQGIARWLQQALQVKTIVLRSRERGRAGEAVLGQLPTEPIPFLENDLKFRADVVHGQKTGFFLDQRDNRQLIRGLSRGRRVLNLFSFNGGFSVAAGQGGASQVTSVDVAAPAIEAANQHWQLNGLQSPHCGLVGDCFEFLENGLSQGQEWELVICDPPSFAPSEKTRQRGLAAYTRLAQLSARATSAGGLLALASCSSHVDALAFANANAEGLGRARRKATLLAERGLPADHPTPLAMPELRYLKFQLFCLD